jgi:hypothetical protein
MAKFSPLVYRKFHNIASFQEDWLIGSNHWTGRRGTYQAIIEAKSKAADKRKLAKFITGNSNDWSLLGGNNKVAPGEKINVSPLLAKFETKLREKIASLCRREQLNASFQALSIKVKKDDGTEEEQALIGVVEVSGKGESAGINRYFTKSTQGSIDCIRAVNLIYAKAVLEVIGKDAFDGVGFTENIQLDEFAGLTNQPMSNMLIGDRGWIRNYADYLEKYERGAWQAENVIKVDRDLYWGFGDKPPKSEMGWMNRLREIYNQGLKPEERRNEPVPGFDGNIIFLDVAYIAEVVFSYNITDK